MKIHKLNIYFFLFIIFSAPIKAQNWTIIDTSVTHTNGALRSAFFTNDTTGYVVGGWGGVGGVILKTIDAGIHWNLTIVNKDLECVYFPSKDTGYAVGQSHTIMKTIDAGTTWVSQFVPSLSTLYTAISVCFINNDTGFVGLKNGPGYAFLKTYNGGANWINDISDTVQANVFFKLNDSSVCGIFGKFSKTTNKGASWTNYSIPVGSWATSLWFLNDSVGFATLDHGNGTPCFNYSSLIKTTNGGQTWTETNYECDFIYSLVFPSNKIGYMLGGVAIGTPRKIWKTTNAGNTWLLSSYPVGVAYDSTSAYGLNMICTDTNTCYILTNYGAIIKTTNGGGNVGINEQSRTKNEDLKIYPNPTQSNITIEFDLTETKNVFLEIKNILGQTIKIIDNSAFEVGRNKVEIVVSEFSKSLYFVQLQSGHGILSKKFVKE